MASDGSLSAAGPLRRADALLGGLQRRLVRIGRVMGDLGGWAYLLCALFVTSDVITRRFFGFSSQGTTEISGYLVAFGISWGLTTAMAEKRHIRVEAILGYFPTRVRSYLHFCAITLLEGVTLLLAVRAWDVVRESVELNAHDTGALSIPLVLPQSLWAFGISVFALLVTLIFIRTLLLLILGEHGLVEEMVGVRAIEEDVEEALEAAGKLPPGAQDAAVMQPVHKS
jgi:TRAP-type C4-dicarboxylate transport system permease small subunit